MSVYTIEAMSPNFRGHRISRDLSVVPLRLTISEYQTATKPELDPADYFVGAGPTAIIPPQIVGGVPIMLVWDVEQETITAWDLNTAAEVTNATDLGEFEVLLVGV